MTIRILGLGNVLMSDDAFGPYVARVLEASYEFPLEVEVVDVGTPGLDLTPYLIDAEAIILIDTVKSSGEAGETRSYDRDDILCHLPQARVSPYDPGLREALLMVGATGRGPSQVKLFGVLPAVVTPGVELSAPVRAAITPVVRMVVAELDRLGHPARPLRVPRRPEAWWEERGAPSLAGR